MSSVARTAIVPMQDILCLDSNARMNTPATQVRWLTFLCALVVYFTQIGLLQNHLFKRAFSKAVIYFFIKKKKTSLYQQLSIFSLGPADLIYHLATVKALDWSLSNTWLLLYVFLDRSSICDHVVSCHQLLAINKSQK